MRNDGFSLVELSIVLVILGLLTGGILAGQSLIRAAELRSVSADYNRYQTALQTFRDKYFALPGDMNTATKFWPATDPVLATCITTPSVGNSTCDGNGDGNISWYDSNNAQHYESFTVWKQMANAGLIEGSYSNIFSNSLQPGINVPSSKLSQAFFMFYSTANNYSDGTHFTFTNGSSFMVLQDSIVGGKLKAEEAWNMDTKMDDGRPGMGAIKTSKNVNCATTGVDNTAEYALTATAAICPLFALSR